VTAGDVLVAYELNGAPLTAQYGFPARLLVPGWYGTNSVKWLRRLQLPDRRADSPSTTVLHNDGPDAPVWATAPESVIVSPAPEAAVRAGQEGSAEARPGADLEHPAPSGHLQRPACAR
jgi:sulfane dehydrogenase subunit SoxC